MENKSAFKRTMITLALIFAIGSVVCDVPLWFLLYYYPLPFDFDVDSLLTSMLMDAFFFALFWNFSQLTLAPIFLLVSFMGYPGKGGKLLLLICQLVILATWFLSVWNMWTVFLHIGSL